MYSINANSACLLTYTTLHRIMLALRKFAGTPQMTNQSIFI